MPILFYLSTFMPRFERKISSADDENITLGPNDENDAKALAEDLLIKRSRSGSFAL